MQLRTLKKGVLTMKRWIKILIPRIAMMIFTLFLIVTITFFLMSSLPGTPYNNQEKLSEKQVAILNEKYGLSDPLPQRYVTYVYNVLHGDFGISLQFSDQKVSKLILDRIGPSLQLGLQAVIFGTVTGTILGIIAAMNPCRRPWFETPAQ